MQVTFSSSIVAAVISAFVALIVVFLAQNMQSKREQRARLTEKLEQMVEVAIKFGRLHQQRYDAVLDYVELEEGNFESLIEKREKLHVVQSRLRMYVLLYFEELKGKEALIRKLLLDLDKHFYAIRTGGVLDKELFKDAYEKLSAAIVDLRTSAIEGKSKLVSSW